MKFFRLLDWLFWDLIGRRFKKIAVPKNGYLDSKNLEKLNTINSFFKTKLPDDLWDEYNKFKWYVQKYQPIRFIEYNQYDEKKATAALREAESLDPKYLATYFSDDQECITSGFHLMEFTNGWFEFKSEFPKDGFFIVSARSYCTVCNPKNEDGVFDAQCKSCNGNDDGSTNYAKRYHFGGYAQEEGIKVPEILRKQVN